jgi:hypothetical protein
VCSTERATSERLLTLPVVRESSERKGVVMEPGVLGWLAVGAVVVVADAVAIHKRQRTMSSVFRHHYEYALPVLAAIVAHLIYREVSA